VGLWQEELNSKHGRRKKGGGLHQEVLSREALLHFDGTGQERGRVVVGGRAMGVWRKSTTCWQRWLNRAVAEAQTNLILDHRRGKIKKEGLLLLHRPLRSQPAPGVGRFPLLLSRGRGAASFFPRRVKKKAPGQAPILDRIFPKKICALGRSTLRGKGSPHHTVKKKRKKRTTNSWPRHLHLRRKSNHLQKHTREKMFATHYQKKKREGKRKRLVK